MAKLKQARTYRYDRHTRSRHWRQETLPYRLCEAVLVKRSVFPRVAEVVNEPAQRRESSFNGGPVDWSQRVQCGVDPSLVGRDPNRAADGPRRERW